MHKPLENFAREELTKTSLTEVGSVLEPGKDQYGKDLCR